MLVSDAAWQKSIKKASAEMLVQAMHQLAQNRVFGTIV